MTHCAIRPKPQTISQQPIADREQGDGGGDQDGDQLRQPPLQSPLQRPDERDDKQGEGDRRHHAARQRQGRQRHDDGAARSPRGEACGLRPVLGDHRDPSTDRPGRFSPPRQHRAPRVITNDQQRQARRPAIRRSQLSARSIASPQAAAAPTAALAGDDDVALRHARQTEARAPQPNGEDPARSAPATAPPRRFRGERSERGPHLGHRIERPGNRDRGESDDQPGPHEAGRRRRRSAGGCRAPSDSAGNGASAMCCRPPTRSRARRRGRRRTPS